MSTGTHRQLHGPPVVGAELEVQEAADFVVLHQHVVVVQVTVDQLFGEQRLVLKPICQSTTHVYVGTPCIHTYCVYTALYVCFLYNIHIHLAKCW